MSPQLGATVTVCQIQYRIIETIGRGSYGTVYKAINTETNDHVAIKIIPQSKVKRPHERKCIEKEIETMRVSVRQYENGHPHIEFCAGGDISSHIKSQCGLAEDGARNYMLQLASALQFLRSQNVIHRDLKPANLLLSNKDSRNAKLKIADFGFARELLSEALAESVVGSPLYMAPELLEYKSYDAKADLWSVGIILYEMIANDHPFLVVGGCHATNHLALRRNIHCYFETHGCVKFPPSIVVSKACTELMQGLLRPNPQDRISFEGFFDSPFLLPPLPTGAPETPLDRSLSMSLPLLDQRSDSAEWIAVSEGYVIVDPEIDPVAMIEEDNEDGHVKSDGVPVSVSSMHPPVGIPSSLPLIPPLSLMSAFPLIPPLLKQEALSPIVEPFQFTQDKSFVEEPKEKKRETSFVEAPKEKKRETSFVETLDKKDKSLVDTQKETKNILRKEVLTKVDPNFFKKDSIQKKIKKNTGDEKEEDNGQSSCTTTPTFSTPTPFSTTPTFSTPTPFSTTPTLKEEETMETVPNCDSSSCTASKKNRDMDIETMGYKIGRIKEENTNVGIKVLLNKEEEQKFLHNQYIDVSSTKHSSSNDNASDHHSGLVSTLENKKIENKKIEQKMIVEEKMIIEEKREGHPDVGYHPQERPPQQVAVEDDEKWQVEEALGICYKSFDIGAVVLFVPTPSGHYIAFNEACPHYYLAAESLECAKKDGRPPSYVLGCIVFMEEHISTETSNPYELHLGTKYYNLTVTALSNGNLTPTSSLISCSHTVNQLGEGNKEVNSGHQRISFRSFQVNDLALFFPTTQSPRYLAFSEGCPHYYLADESIEVYVKPGDSTPPPPYICGEIIMIDTAQATEDCNPYQLDIGTTYSTVTVSSFCS